MKNITIDQAITHILQTQKIAEQSMLQEILADQGLQVPQATLSRRLKKLQAVKIKGFYQILSFPNGQTHLPFIHQLQYSTSGIIVLHTAPGQASSLAYYLDQNYVHGAKHILGTIAGDDTVLAITQNPEHMHTFLVALSKDAPYTQSYWTT